MAFTFLDEVLVIEIFLDQFVDILRSARAELAQRNGLILVTR